ncbi:MAG: PHP domain-containing protein [Oscillospiraceae bacterium]|nr:PHP domain-containing protein [Oscillospiraceae bacterium]
MKLELHIHASEHSACADESAAGCVARCAAQGYDGMVLTNHFYANCMGDADGDWTARIDRFMRGYDAAVAAAPEGFTVILGMELRFADEGENDYLILGLDEPFLREHEDFDALGLAKFSALAREHGLLICQAHPFRYGMRVRLPDYLDAYEVYNGHGRWESNNEIAASWCKRHSKLALSGSDWHGYDTELGANPGGIVLDYPVKDSRELVQIIRAGKFSLLF